MLVEAGKAPELGPQVLEINGGHPIIRQLSATHAAQPELAAKVGAQLYANALIAAGLLDDPRTILANLNSILEETLEKDLDVALPVHLDMVYCRSLSVLLPWAKKDGVKDGLFEVSLEDLSIVLRRSAQDFSNFFKTILGEEFA